MDPNAELYEKGVPVEIHVGKAVLHGDLTIPDQALGLMIFVHGSGSRSANNIHAANELNQQQFATLLIDLLTPQEQNIDSETMEFRFDISLLSTRSIAVAEWALRDPKTAQLPIGLLGTGVGTAAALIAASVMKKQVAAVVSWGGRAALAEEALASVISPTC